MKTSNKIRFLFVNTEGTLKEHWGVARSDAFYQRLCSVLFVEQVSIHANAGGAHEYDENTWEDE